MQKFFESTIISTFIKYLLSCNPLPIYPTLTTDEYMVKGMKYIYKDDILECTKSGYLKGIKSMIDSSKMSEYKLIGKYNFGTYYSNITKNFVSNVNYYDSRTHRILGEYLRCLKNIYNVDLMALYNCFDYTVVDNVYIDDKGVNVGSNTVLRDKTVATYDTHTITATEFNSKTISIISPVTKVDSVSLIDPNHPDVKIDCPVVTGDTPGASTVVVNYDNGLIKFSADNENFKEGYTVEISYSYYSVTYDNKKKLILVPIKFNKQYTIAIESTDIVFMSPVLYDGRNIIENNYSAVLNNFVKRYNNLQFNNPILISVPNTEEIHKSTATKLMNYEKYLYLAIQLPNSNKSSIVVLEGDYTDIPNHIICSSKDISKVNDYYLSDIFKSKCSLLDTNDGIQRPFSDKLIEFLLRYTIDNREYIDENIEGVEKAINYKSHIKDFYYGIWDNDLRYTLYSYYMNLSNNRNLNKTDITGFIDLDIENAINNKLINIRSPQQEGLKPYDESESI